MLTFRTVECYAKGGRRFTVGPSLWTTGAVHERDCKVCGVSGEPESRPVREIGFAPLSKPLQNKVSNNIEKQQRRMIAYITFEVIII